MTASNYMPLFILLAVFGLPILLLAGIKVVDYFRKNGVSQKKTLFLALAISASLTSLDAQAAQNTFQERTWTLESTGHSIQAAFALLDQGQVYLKKNGGEIAIVPIENLTQMDQIRAAQSAGLFFQLNDGAGEMTQHSTVLAQTYVAPVQMIAIVMAMITLLLGMMYYRRVIKLFKYDQSWKVAAE